MTNTIDGSISIIEWDSSFFSKKIGKFNFEKGNNNFKKTKLNYDLIVVKIDCKEYNLIDLLLLNGFILAETEIVIGFTTEKETKVNFSIANTNDIEKIIEIAKTSFLLNSRYRSPWFTKQDREKFYSKWAENSILGKFDDECLVISKEDKIRGFISLKFHDNDHGQIGLVSTHTGDRRSGVGLDLVNSALSRFKSKGVKNVKVATQSSNISAIRLYEKAGGMVISASYWLYYSKKKK